MNKYKSIFKESNQNAFDQVEIKVSNMIFSDLVEHIASLNQFGKDIMETSGSNNQFWNKYLTDKVRDEIDDRLLFKLTRNSPVQVEVKDLYNSSDLTDNYDMYASDFQIDEIIMKHEDVHVEFTASFTGRWNEMENDDLENPIFSDEQKEVEIEVKGAFIKTSTGWECELD